MMTRLVRRRGCVIPLLGWSETMVMGQVACVRRANDEKS
jgi:hypothetical protein